MKRKKLTPMPKLLKKVQVAWGAFIRARDKECAVCFRQDTLQAHHCIVPKNKGNSTRFLEDNGITLCYSCHIGKVHGGTERRFWYDHLNRIIDIKVPKKRQDEIIALSYEIRKYDRTELEAMKLEFETKTIKLQL